MAQVTLRINGYGYTVACEDGQEEHLQSMAAAIDGQVEGIKARGNTGSESRLLVMAGLMMADRVHDLQVELDELKKNAARTSSKLDAAAGRKLSALAKRAEEIAAILEQS